MFVSYCSQLKKDIKMTNIEELQIQSETYYQEVLVAVSPSDKNGRDFESVQIV